MPGKSKRPWRKELKKQQRKRRRQKAAEERDMQLEEEEANKLKDPAYQDFQQQKAQLAEELLRLAEFQHAQEETAWLRRDLLAHREFCLKQKQREAAEAAEAAIRRQQEAELAAKLADEKRRREQEEKRQAAVAAEFEKTMKHMEAFLNHTGPAPPELRRIVESRPGQNNCSLYESTNCCRFGASCLKNHRRPLLSKVIVVRHFFMHPLLDEERHMEYACADGYLEFNEQDLCEAYNLFFEDIVPELEEFGVIRNLRTVRNVLKHMRGHVFIEYFNERAALKAFTRLQGRFYAGRQLNVEFSSITAWEKVVCGLAIKNKCQRGGKCFYLHVLTNPGNKYSTPLVLGKKPITKTPVATPLLSWDMVTSRDMQSKSRNWRWSESPEVEIKSKAEKEKSEKKDGEKRNTSTLSSNASQSHTNLLHNSSKQRNEEKGDGDSNPNRRRRKKHTYERNKYEHHCAERKEEHKERRDSAEENRSNKSKYQNQLKYKEDSNGRNRSTERSNDERRYERNSSKEHKAANAIENAGE